MPTLKAELRKLLDKAPRTSDFIAEATAAIEQLYGETGDECPDGFTALDAAFQAFDDAGD